MGECSPSIKWSQSIAGLTASACAAFSLVVSISRCCAYPTTLSPIPCRRSWNEVSRAERPRWSPKVPARRLPGLGSGVCLPCCASEDLTPNRSLQGLDDPFHRCAALHPVVAEDTLCVLNEVDRVAAIRLSRKAWQLWRLDGSHGGCCGWSAMTLGGQIRSDQTAPLHRLLVVCDSSTSNPDRRAKPCREAGWGVEGSRLET